MAISACDQLKHVANSVTEEEAEVYLTAPELLAACRALVELADGNPRQYGYDTALQAVVDQARAAVEQATGKRE